MGSARIRSKTSFFFDEDDADRRRARSMAMMDNPMHPRCNPTRQAAVVMDASEAPAPRQDRFLTGLDFSSVDETGGGGERADSVHDEDAPKPGLASTLSMASKSMAQI